MVMRDQGNFGKKEDGFEVKISHDRVKKALQADGSLLVMAEINFLSPDDSGVKAIDEKCDLITK